MDPKWTCEECGTVCRIFGGSMDTAKNQLVSICRTKGHQSKPYYTAGVRL